MKRTKIISGVLVALIVAWYFTKGPAVDMDAAKLAYEASAAKMKTQANVNRAAPADPSAKAPASAKADGPAKPSPSLSVAKTSEPQPMQHPMSQPSESINEARVIETAPQSTSPLESVEPEELHPIFIEAIRPAKRSWASIPDAEREGVHSLYKPVSEAEWQDVAESIDDEAYVARKGDTLSKISRRVYGDSHLWPKLWAINPHIENPYQLKIGTTLHLR